MFENVLESLKELLAQMKETFNTETIIGEPLEFNDKTIIPIAKRSFGAGGGFGDPPSKMGFSRFMKRLSEAEVDQRLFQEAIRQLKEADPRRRGRPKKGR